MGPSRGEPMKHDVECTIPVLPVRNLSASIAFYTDALGFVLDWSSATVCSVSRDGKPIMLREAEGDFAPAWVWIGLEDDSLFAEFAKRGARVLQPPRNYAWAYEMKLQDLDGNVLWLGTESKQNLPVEAG
jgi:predicted lactoylglutathione lyase